MYSILVGSLQILFARVEEKICHSFMSQISEKLAH